MVTPARSSPKGPSNFFPLHIYQYGSLYLFMIVSIAKKLNTSRQNKTILHLSYFLKKTTHFNWRISMDTNFPISPSQENFCIFVKIEAFRLFFLTYPTTQRTSKSALLTHLNHWITQISPPQYPTSDRGSDYIFIDMTHFCSCLKNRHSPCTPYSPWQMIFLEHKTETLAHTFVFFQLTPFTNDLLECKSALLPITQPVFHLLNSDYIKIICTLTQELLPIMT